MIDEDMYRNLADKIFEYDAAAILYSNLTGQFYLPIRKIIDKLDLDIREYHHPRRAYSWKKWAAESTINVLQKFIPEITFSMFNEMVFDLWGATIKIYSDD